MPSDSVGALQRRLLEALSPKLEERGFKPRITDQSFARHVDFGRWILHVSFIRHRTDFDATVDAAIRVDDVEDLINEDRTSLPKATRNWTATIGAELGNLRSGAPLRWTIRTDRDVPPVAADMLNAIKTTGIPYLEKHSDLRTILGILASNDRAAWLHAPVHDSRCKRALALAQIIGDSTLFSEIAESCRAFLTERSDPGLASFLSFVERLERRSGKELSK